MASKVLLLLLVSASSVLAQLNNPNFIASLKPAPGGGGGGGGGTPTLTQSKSYNGAAASSHSITFDATATSGDLIVLVVCSSATVTTPSGYSVGASAVNFVGLYVYYKVSNGTETGATVSPTSSADMTIRMMQWRNVDTLDQTATTTTGGSGNVVSIGPTGTTTAADEVIICAMGCVDSGAQDVNSWDTGFTIDSEITNGAGNAFSSTGYKVVSATGTQSASASVDVSGSTYSGIVCTFKN